MLDPKLKVILKLTKKDGKVKHYRPMTFARFIQLHSLTSFTKAYVKIIYPKKEYTAGCTYEFANWGTYDNKKDLVFAVKAFLER